MVVRVADVELNASLPALDAARDACAMLLVRRAGRPVGLVRVDARGGMLTAARLRAAIAAQIDARDAGSALCPAPAAPMSVIVCTRNRTALLVTCLEALQEQAAAGHEIIVVDNAPDGPGTRALASRYRCRYACEPRPGLNHARNKGLALARHTLVAFTDDDCIPDPGWLDALAAPYADPRVGAATGLVVPYELETAAQERFEAYCANRRIFAPRVFQAPHTPPSTAGECGMGANMSFRRELLLRLGGFDVRFDGGTPTLSGGDTEMFARLLDAGARIAYRPEALVWHRHCRDAAALRRVIFGYGVGLYAVLTKRLVEDRDWRVLLIAPRWFAGPPLKALCNRLRGRPAAALDLVLMEGWGAIHGPLRYRAVRHLSPSSLPLEVGPACDYTCA